MMKEPYCVLRETKLQANQDIDTYKNILFLLTKSTIVVQREDGVLWTHRMIIEHETDDHHGRIQSQGNQNRPCNHQIEQTHKSNQYVCRRLSLE